MNNVLWIGEIPIPSKFDIITRMRGRSFFLPGNHMGDEASFKWCQKKLPEFQGFGNISHFVKNIPLFEKLLQMATRTKK